MSVSAAELPAMSGAVGVEPAGADTLRRRLDAGLRQIAFFVVPSAMAFLALGDVIAGGAVSDRPIQRTPTRCTCGAFSRDRRWGCWRPRWAACYSSTYYALRDTRTPLRLRRDPRRADHGAGLRVRDSAAAWLGIAQSGARRD